MWKKGCRKLITFMEMKSKSRIKQTAIIKYMKRATLQAATMMKNMVNSSLKEMYYKTMESSFTITKTRVTRIWKVAPKEELRWL